MIVSSSFFSIVILILLTCSAVVKSDSTSMTKIKVKSGNPLKFVDRCHLSLTSQITSKCKYYEITCNTSPFLWNFHSIYRQNFTYTCIMYIFLYSYIHTSFQFIYKKRYTCICIYLYN